MMFQAFAGRTQLVVALANVPFLDLFVSFSPLVTHGKNDHLREASFEVPLNRLLLESHAPHCTRPSFEPSAGCIDSEALTSPDAIPAHVLFVADTIARVKRCEAPALLAQCTANACDFFRLPEPEPRVVPYPEPEPVTEEEKEVATGSLCREVTNGERGGSGGNADGNSEHGAAEEPERSRVNSGGVACEDEGNANGEWHCPACTFLNKPLGLACKICGRSRVGDMPLVFDDNEGIGDSDEEEVEDDPTLASLEEEAELARIRKAEEKRRKKKQQKKKKVALPE